MADEVEQTEEPVTPAEEVPSVEVVPEATSAPGVAIPTAEPETAVVPPEAPSGPMVAEDAVPVIIENGGNGSNGGEGVPLETTSMQANPVSNGILKPLNKQTAKELSVKGHRAKFEIRSSKLERIMKEVNIKGSVNNDKVQILLGVSDATAARYLSILVREGRVIRVGRGNAVRYRKN